MRIAQRTLNIVFSVLLASGVFINNRGSFASAETAASTKDIDFGPYMSTLQKLIKQNWFSNNAPGAKKVVVSFKVHSKGNVSDLAIFRSSGISSEDNIALQAVRNCDPFAPLPDGAPENVDIQFAFDFTLVDNPAKELELSKALSDKEKAVSSNSPELLPILLDLGDCLSSQRKLADAISVFNRAQEISKSPTTPIVFKKRVTSGLAICYGLMGKHADAENLLQANLDLFKVGTERSELPYADALRTMGNCLAVQHKYKEALNKYEDALSIYEKVFGANNPKVAEMLNSAGACYFNLNQFASSEAYSKKALAVCRKIYSEDDARLADQMSELATCLNEEKKYEEAESLFKSAIAIKSKALGADSNEVAVLLKKLGDCQHAERKPD